MLKVTPPPPIFPDNFDSIRVLPDSSIEHSELSEFGRLIIQPRIYDKFVIVSPCRGEHWISTDLFKFRIYAERNRWHVIGACSLNQTPHFSLFCDEIIFEKAFPVWYKRVTGNGVKVGDLTKHHKYLNIQDSKEIRDKFTEEVANEDVIERYSCKEICILESAYDKFLLLKDSLPRNVVVAEMNYQPKPQFEADWLIGVNQNFQRDLVEKVGTDSYMSVQILGSNFLNWQYLCEGGSANLMSVLPIRTICMRDHTYTPSVKNIIRGFAARRGVESPYIDKPSKLKQDDVYRRLMGQAATLPRLFTVVGQ